MIDPTSESRRRDDVLLDVREVRLRYRWIRDDRAARRIIEQAGGRLIAGRWAVPLDLLLWWERAWHRPGVARQAAKPAPSGADTRRVAADASSTDLAEDWWRE